MTDAEAQIARNTAKILSEPGFRAAWLRSLGADRPAYIAALKGNAPAWMHPLDRERYAAVGRLLGPAVLAAL